MLWLIAAEYENGTITASPEDIAWRLRMSVDEFNAAIIPLVERGFFSQDSVAIEPLAPCEQETRPETETETQVQKEEEKIGGGEGTRAKSKSLISEEAFETSAKVLVAMGLDPQHPLSVGAPLTIQGWMNERWNPECIIIGVKRGMNSRNGDPPTTLKYFEKAIARAHAELTPSLPTVQIRQAETIQVTRGTSQNQSGGSLIAAIDRQLAAIEAEDGADLALSEKSVLRLSN